MTNQEVGMKGIITALLVCLFCSALPAAEPSMTPEERAKAIKLMRDSQKEFLEAVEKLSEAQWAYKPAPERWSVGEVAEHIMLSESLLFGIVEKVLAVKPDPDWEAKTAGKAERLERALPNRERKAQAPEVLKPQGKWTKAEILSRFKEARAKTLKFAEETSAPLKQYTQENPFFGTLNAYHWLIYVPLHNIRHNQQMVEVKADAGFPK